MHLDMGTDNLWMLKWIVLEIQPGGLFIEPAFSTLAVFVIDFIPQITVVLHLSQSSISLKSTRVLFTGYVNHLSGTLFFSALSVLHNFCSERFLWELFPHLHCQARTCVQILLLSQVGFLAH